MGGWQFSGLRRIESREMKTNNSPSYRIDITCNEILWGLYNNDDDNVDGTKINQDLTMCQAPLYVHEIHLTTLLISPF